MFRNVISLIIAQALYEDCAKQFSGFTHLGFKGVILRENKHSLIFGLGPTLIYRRSWYRLKGYHGIGFFNYDEDWESRFIWYGGEIEYNYHLNDKFDLSATVIPGYPNVINLSLGCRYWFKR